MTSRNLHPTLPAPRLVLLTLKHQNSPLLGISEKYKYRQDKWTEIFYRRFSTHRNNPALYHPRGQLPPFLKSVPATDLSDIFLAAFREMARKHHQEFDFPGKRGRKITEKAQRKRKKCMRNNIMERQR